MNAISTPQEATSERAELEKGHELNSTLSLYLSLRDLFDQELPKLRASLKLPDVKAFTSTPFLSKEKALIATANITPQCTLNQLQEVLNVVVLFIGHYIRLSKGQWSNPTDLNLPYWQKLQSDLKGFQKLADERAFPITGETQIGRVMDFMGAMARRSMQDLVDGQFGMPRHVEVEGANDIAPLQATVRELLGFEQYEGLKT